SNDFKEIKNAKDKTEYLEFRPENIEDLFSFLDLPNTFEENKGFDEIKRFILLCNEHNKLTDWSIVIKTTGRARTLNLNGLGFNLSIDRTKRDGPSEKSRCRDNLINNHIFAAGGASANILTGGKDLQIRLTDAVIKQATKDFIEQWIKEYKDNNPELTEDKILDKYNKLNVPEKVYRQKMTSKEGVLVIYLMDLALVFESGGHQITELKGLKESINTDEVPLIGYAIGIPAVGDDIGGTYLQSKFHEEPETSGPDDDQYDDYQDDLEM
ncbi:MAG: hypothetical protein GQ532_13225, partial [Methylomarinum sp.]|nr:hypothetical protein [Methylomarinum sp.]